MTQNNDAEKQTALQTLINELRELITNSHEFETTFSSKASLTILGSRGQVANRVTSLSETILSNIYGEEVKLNTAIVARVHSASRKITLNPIKDS